MSQAKSFLHYWQEKAQNEGDLPFLKVVQSVSPPVLAYTKLAFQKRAMRVAVSFKNLLEVPEGGRVVLLLDEPNDLALLLHGLWMAKICAIPVSAALPPDRLQRLIEETGAQYVLFPPSYSARIASIIDTIGSVKNWIVTGKAGQVAGVQNVKSLEDLLLSAAGEELRDDFDRATEREVLLLPYFSDGLSVMSFTEIALIRAGLALQQLYPQDGGEGMAWNTYPIFSFDGILHSLLAPLFTPTPSLIMPITDLREFWRHLSANEICFAAITHRDAEHIYGLGKARALKFMEKLTLAISADSYFSHRVISNFLERFELPVIRFFSYAPCGGILSVSKPNDDTHDDDYMSAGKLLPDVLVQSGREHMLSVTTDRSMHDCSGKSIPARKGRAVEMPFSGRTEAQTLWIEGKTDDIDYREGQQINLARIEQALLSIRGVTYAVAACVPGKRNDREIGVFVATHRLANLSQDDLERELRGIIGDHELPYIYEFARQGEDEYPDRKELEDRLMFY